ncbi:MAG: DUF190 domain-containing protein [Myxococcota bacterium]
MEASKLLLVVVGEGHRHGGIPLYEFVVRRLRQLGLAGATAIPAEIGFGHHELIRRDEPLEFPTDRPVVVFAVDEAARIEGVLAAMRELVPDGLVAVLDAQSLPRR